MTAPVIACSGPIGQVALDILKPYGEIRVAKDSSEASLLEIAGAAIGLVLRGDGVGSARVIEAAPELKVIGRSGVGYDNVDIPAANARKIPVIITPGANDRAVAEAAIAYMLVLCKKLFHWDTQLKSGKWQSRFEQESGDLDGGTLGIIGFGRIGKKLAELIRPFDMTVLACDPFVSKDTAETLGVTLVDLEELLRRSDFISVHTLLCKDTRCLINSERIRLMKPGSFLINLSRGGVVESLDVLYEGLVNGPLAGVGLDVFDQEPPDVSHPIFKLQNCLTSPHIAGMTNRALYRLFKVMAEGMADVFEGRKPPYAANPEIYG